MEETKQFTDAGLLCFIVLHFIVCHRCCVFYKLKARPSTSQKLTTHFIVMFALLWWSGIEVCLHKDKRLVGWMILVFFLLVESGRQL